MSNLTILRSYAQRSKPGSLPPSILFSYKEKTITIFDAFPKSMFHFLILPRTSAFTPLSVFDLSSLRTLLRRDKTKAKEVIVALKEEAKNLRTSIEEEMIDRYGFKWDIWMGFHPVPSMEYVLSFYQRHWELWNDEQSSTDTCISMLCPPICARRR